MGRVPGLSLADKLHRGFVCCCIGMTLLGALHICTRGYEYIVHVRPVRMLEREKIEKELLREGELLPEGQTFST